MLRFDYTPHAQLIYQLVDFTLPGLRLPFGLRTFILRTFTVGSVTVVGLDSRTHADLLALRLHALLVGLRSDWLRLITHYAPPARTRFIAAFAFAVATVYLRLRLRYVCTHAAFAVTRSFFAVGYICVLRLHGLRWFGLLIVYARTFAARYVGYTRLVAFTHTLHTLPRCCGYVWFTGCYFTVTTRTHIRGLRFCLRLVNFIYRFAVVTVCVYACTRCRYTALRLPFIVTHTLPVGSATRARVTRLLVY